MERALHVALTATLLADGDVFAIGRETASQLIYDVHYAIHALGSNLDEIPLPIEALRVLSSRRRFDILRLLLHRRMTATEVGETLRIPKGTVHAHLQQLARAGFVGQHKDGRLWVYYSLTPIGRQLAESDRPRIVIQLGVALGSILGGILLLLRPRGVGVMDEGENANGANGSAGETPIIGPGELASTGWMDLLGLGLLILGIALLVFAGWRSWTRLRRAARSGRAS